ncbi:MAG: hypothetical protein IPN92_20725 [Chromatiaceae bacterium]|nr:hypothetical protein [Chromatiaceae bacterium]
MDRLFRQSGLMRDKWDTVHHATGETYGQASIIKAVAFCRETYRAGGKVQAAQNRLSQRKKMLILMRVN